MTSRQIEDASSAVTQCINALAAVRTAQSKIWEVAPEAEPHLVEVISILAEKLLSNQSVVNPR